MEARMMKNAPDPPSSPDSALFDFVLWSNVKRTLSGLSVDNADEFLRAIHHILEMFEGET
jgi:hypothetical protein